MTGPILRGVTYAPTGLDLGELALAKWLDVLRGLGAMASGHQWWIGDALVYGEERYGEAFAQGEVELGLPPATAANYRYVASRLDRSRRREDLTWSHHAEVARLGPDAQAAALELAATEAWNVRQLRDYVALTYPQSDPRLFGDDAGDSPGAARAEADLQARLERIELALDAGDVDPLDVRWLLDLAKRLTRGGGSRGD